MCRAVMYMYPWSRTLCSSQQGYSSMTASGWSKWKISMSFLARAVGPESGLSPSRGLSPDMRSRSKLGRAAI